MHTNTHTHTRMHTLFGIGQMLQSLQNIRLATAQSIFQSNFATFVHSVPKNLKPPKRPKFVQRQFFSLLVLNTLSSHSPVMVLSLQPKALGSHSGHLCDDVGSLPENTVPMKANSRLLHKITCYLTNSIRSQLHTR